MHPFSQDSSASLAALGEIKIIERIRCALGNVAPATPRGMGDDCAVLPAHESGSRLVTTDSLIYGKHFDANVSPEDAGKKLIRRNVSDIAAMGGSPSDAVLAFVMSENVSALWLDCFLDGIAEACRESGIELSGGDVAATPCDNFFSATLALTGFAEKPLLRTGAQEGDFLFVTGTLGGSILRKHFAFCPRIEEGLFLASQPDGIIRSCIDVTDGLQKDHAALLPPGTHAEFFYDAIPISPDVACLAEAESAGKIPTGCAAGTPLQHAFCDGEDYELLFAVAREHADSLERAWKERFPKVQLSRIAQIVAGNGNPELKQKLSDAQAYRHF